MVTVPQRGLELGQVPSLLITSRVTMAASETPASFNVFVVTLSAVDVIW